jgi:hypothetical protein
LSVQFGSYLDGGWGDPVRRSSGDNGSHKVGLANLWAATRSESRAGSESTVVTPTRHHRGEGRRSTGKQPTQAPVLVTGVLGAARREGSSTQRGRPGRGVGLRPTTPPSGWRPQRDSERPILPGKPGNAGGGKGPHFRVLRKGTRARRLAVTPDNSDLVPTFLEEAGRGGEGERLLSAQGGVTGELAVGPT